MSRSILPPFDTFQAEAAIIGKLLAGYTTLEVGLMHCIQVVRDDFDAVLKAMFRARGETQRIDVADALGRHFYHDRGLGTEFEMCRERRPVLLKNPEPVCALCLVRRQVREIGFRKP